MSESKLKSLRGDATGVVRFGFLILPEFPLYGLVPATEALRIANQNYGRKLYDWSLISEESSSVSSGIGMSLGVDTNIGDAD